MFVMLISEVHYVCLNNIAIISLDTALLQQNNKSKKQLS